MHLIGDRPERPGDTKIRAKVKVCQVCISENSLSRYLSRFPPLIIYVPFNQINLLVVPRGFPSAALPC
jgi:hypothetical protein